MYNKVIILNGTSSVGKTTLAKAFQQHSKECYYYLSMDNIHTMLPDKYLIYRNHKEFNSNLPLLTEENKKGFYFENDKKIKLGDYAININNDFIDLIYFFCEKKRNVIVDAIIYGDKLREIKEHLSDYNVYIFKLQCEINILREREKQRGNRVIGSAEYGEQFVDKYYDYIIDNENSVDSVDKIIDIIKKI
jgi:chloramphenicol 3-O phosphotransferase